MYIRYTLKYTCLGYWHIHIMISQCNKIRTRETLCLLIKTHDSGKEDFTRLYQKLQVTDSTLNEGGNEQIRWKRMV